MLDSDVIEPGFANENRAPFIFLINIASKGSFAAPLSRQTPERVCPRAHILAIRLIPRGWGGRKHTLAQAGFHRSNGQNKLVFGWKAGV